MSRFEIADGHRPPLQWVSGGYQGRSSWLVSFRLETVCFGRKMSNLSCPMYAVQCTRPTDLTTKLSRNDSSSRHFGSLGQLVNCIGHSTWDIRHLTTASLSHEFRDPPLRG